MKKIRKFVVFSFAAVFLILLMWITFTYTSKYQKTYVEEKIEMPSNHAFFANTILNDKIRMYGYDYTSKTNLFSTKNLKCFEKTDTGWNDIHINWISEIENYLGGVEIGNLLIGSYKEQEYVLAQKKMVIMFPRKFYS